MLVPCGDGFSQRPHGTRSDTSRARRVEPAGRVDLVNAGRQDIGDIRRVDAAGGENSDSAARLGYQRSQHRPSGERGRGAARGQHSPEPERDGSLECTARVSALIENPMERERDRGAAVLGGLVSDAYEPCEQDLVKPGVWQARADDDPGRPGTHGAVDIGRDAFDLSAVVEKIARAGPDENVNWNRRPNGRFDQLGGWGESADTQVSAQLDPGRTPGQRLTKAGDVIHADFQHAGGILLSLVLELRRIRETNLGLNQTLRRHFSASLMKVMMR